MNNDQILQFLLKDISSSEELSLLELYLKRSEDPLLLKLFLKRKEIPTLSRKNIIQAAKSYLLIDLLNFFHDQLLYTILTKKTTDKEKEKFAKVFFYRCALSIDGDNPKREYESIERLNTIMSALGDIARTSLQTKYNLFYIAIKNMKYEFALTLIDYYDNPSLEAPFIDFDFLTKDSPFFIAIIPERYTFLEYTIEMAGVLSLDKNNNLGMILEGTEKIVRKLLERGVDVNGKKGKEVRELSLIGISTGNPMFLAEKFNFQSIIKLLGSVSGVRSVKASGEMEEILEFASAAYLLADEPNVEERMIQRIYKELYTSSFNEHRQRHSTFKDMFYTGFQKAIFGFSFVTPIINYFDDKITEKNQDKPFYLYYGQEIFRNIVAFGSFKLVKFILPEESPIAAEVIITKFITDAALSSEGNFFSKEYGWDLLTNLVSSFGSFTLLNYNRNYVVHNPFKTAFFIQVLPATAKLAYHYLMYKTNFLGYGNVENLKNENIDSKPTDGKYLQQLIADDAVIPQQIEESHMVLPTNSSFYLQLLQEAALF